MANGNGNGNRRTLVSAGNEALADTVRANAAKVRELEVEFEDDGLDEEGDEDDGDEELEEKLSHILDDEAEHDDYARPRRGRYVAEIHVGPLKNMGYEFDSPAEVFETVQKDVEKQPVTTMLTALLLSVSRQKRDIVELELDARSAATSQTIGWCMLLGLGALGFFALRKQGPKP